jgi:hypothetical protein
MNLRKITFKKTGLPMIDLVELAERGLTDPWLLLLLLLLRGGAATVRARLAQVGIGLEVVQ